MHHRHVIATAVDTNISRNNNKTKKAATTTNLPKHMIQMKTITTTAQLLHEIPCNIQYIFINIMVVVAETEEKVLAIKSCKLNDS